MEVTSVLSPSLTNQFYAGAAYLAQIFNLGTPSAVEGESYSLLFDNGTKAPPSLQTYGSSTYDGFPFATIEDPTFGNDFTKKQLRLAGDNITKLIRQHTLRAGIFYQWVDNPQVQTVQNTNGSLSDYYHPATFTDADGSTVAGTGNCSADLCEGIIGGISQTNQKVETNLHFFSLSGYVQDHWLVNRHRSLDAGVRLEHFTPWLDPHGQGVAIFGATACASGAPLVSPGVLYHAVDKSIPLSGVPTRPAFINPRFGFVYDVYGNSRTILRAGYGVYRQHDSYNDGLLSAQTAEGQRSVSTTASGHTFKNLYLNQGNITASASGFVKDRQAAARSAPGLLLTRTSSGRGLRQPHGAVHRRSSHRRTIGPGVVLISRYALPRIGSMVLAAFLLVQAVAQAQTPPLKSDEGAYSTGAYRNLFLRNGHTEPESRAKIDSAYRQLFHEDRDHQAIAFDAGSNANGPLMYVTDWANHDVRAEGMSYGMMIAVQLDRKKDFDAIWNWAKTNPAHRDQG